MPIFSDLINATKISVVETALNSTIGNVETIQQTIQLNTYNKGEIDNLILPKANIADVYDKGEIDTMLSGVGGDLNNVYTKSETDTALNLKANVADVYTKTQSDTALGLKANSADVYTKTQSDTALNLKANTSDVNTSLNLKANATDVYTKTQSDTALNLKANSADVYTKTQSDTALALKANQSTTYSKTESDNLLNAKINSSLIGVANGLCPLDSGNKVDINYLPTNIMQYKGTWNATTNTPTLTNGVGDIGDIYIVSIAGTWNTISFAISDWIIYNGSTWQKSDANDDVVSVFGRIGVVSAQESDYSGFFYTKAISDGKYALQTSLNNYYDKTTSDGKYALQTSLSNYLTTANATSTYYDKTTSDGKYALQTSLSNYALSSSLSNYLTTANATSTYYDKTTSDGKYALQTSLSNYYDKTTSDGKYALQTALSNYLTTANATSTYYDKTTSDGKYALQTALSNYALSSSLSNYKTTSSFNTDIANYPLTSTLSDFSRSLKCNYLESRNLTYGGNNATTYDAMVLKNYGWGSSSGVELTLTVNNILDDITTNVSQIEHRIITSGASRLLFRVGSLTNSASSALEITNSSGTISSLFNGQITCTSAQNPATSANLTAKSYVDGAITTALTPYLTSANASSTYLTQTNASSTYLSQSNASSTYQPISGMSSYLTTANANSTYQTIVGMTSYLTTASASSTYLTQSNATSIYQTIAGMTSYLTTANASSTYLTQSNATSIYQTIAGMSSYLTTSTASSTYQPISGMSSYLTTANATSTYLTQSNASSTYLTQSNASSTYLTQSNANSTYQTISSMSSYPLTSTLSDGSRNLSVLTNESVCGLNAYSATIFTGMTIKNRANASSTQARLNFVCNGTAGDYTTCQGTIDMRVVTSTGGRMLLQVGTPNNALASVMELTNSNGTTSALFNGQITCTSAQNPSSSVHLTAKSYVDGAITTAVAPYLLSSTASSTYQTQSAMSSYYTSAQTNSLLSSYQTTSGMSSYYNKTESDGRYVQSANLSAMQTSSALKLAISSMHLSMSATLNTVTDNYYEYNLSYTNDSTRKWGNLIIPMNKSFQRKSLGKGYDMTRIRYIAYELMTVENIAPAEGSLVSCLIGGSPLSKYFLTTNSNFYYNGNNTDEFYNSTTYISGGNMYYSTSSGQSTSTIATAYTYPVSRVVIVCGFYDYWNGSKYVLRQIFFYINPNTNAIITRCENNQMQSGSYNTYNYCDTFQEFYPACIVNSDAGVTKIRYYHTVPTAILSACNVYNPYDSSVSYDFTSGINIIG